jgi:hypothetical protein
MAGTVTSKNKRENLHNLYVKLVASMPYFPTISTVFVGGTGSQPPAPSTFSTVN